MRVLLRSIVCLMETILNHKRTFYSQSKFALQREIVSYDFWIRFDLIGLDWTEQVYERMFYFE